MKKSMITIEILVSLLILFLVIVTSTTSIKFFQTVNKQKSNYEDQYIAVLSLKDKLSSSICISKFKEEGIWNGFGYTAICTKTNELKSFKKGFDIDEPSGNIGNYMMNLYTVKLVIENKNYSYYITHGKKLF
ncbi:MAG: hypothetical protein U9N59_13455 [Campylobacterota bacterium]|nr:hypothetical protein [Campylobacterota bacterium]